MSVVTHLITVLVASLPINEEALASVSSYENGAVPILCADHSLLISILKATPIFVISERIRLVRVEVGKLL